MLKRYYIHHPNSIFQNVILVEDIKHPDLKIKKRVYKSHPMT